MVGGAGRGAKETKKKVEGFIWIDGYLIDFVLLDVVVEVVVIVAVEGK